MNIYGELPLDWKDLQIKVGEILSEIGYECEIEKNINTVREKVNVDVLAINSKETPRNSIICECKYWNNAVPKTIVHSFRTIVSDFGANFGIIISKKGFQSGSIQAVKNTNILLFNWIEFQEYFKIKWIKNKQYSVSKITKPLYHYVSAGFYVFSKDKYNEMSDLELSTFNELNQKYFHFAFNSSNLDYKNPNNNEFDLRVFEMFIEQFEKEFNMKFSSYNEYYDFLINESIKGIKEFDLLFKQEIRIKNYS